MRIIYQFRIIIITHAHVDHAGNANVIRRLRNVKNLAHASDLKYYERREVMHFCSTDWFGDIFLKTNLIYEPYEPFTPDILLKSDEEFDLSSCGVDGKVVSTPGHTCGSISVILKNEVALVGDLVSSEILLGGIMFTSKPNNLRLKTIPNKSRNISRIW